MKNLKKVLSLVLALAMALSLMTVAFAKEASDYTDYGTITNKEAVEVLTALNVIDGMGDSFQPNGNVTRAQMAKMITIISLGNVDPTAFLGTVTDLKDINGHWAEAYIKYCYSQGIISGKGNGIFDPNANVTSAEASKMLLTAIGYNAGVQGYTGPQWAINVTRDAQTSGFYAGVSVPANQALTRDQAAQMIYNAVLATMIEKTSTVDRVTGNVSDHYAPYDDKDTTLLRETFGGNRTTLTYNGDHFVNTTLKEGQIKVGSNTATYTMKDGNALIGEKVEVLWKDNETKGTKNALDQYDTVYGVYPTGETSVLNVTSNDIASASDYTTAGKIKVAGTEYEVANITTGTNIIVKDFGATAATDGAGTNANATAFKGLSSQNGDTVKFILNDDGKVEKAYVQTYKLGTVTAVNSEKVTISGLGSIKIADNDIYSGIAKNDVVVYSKLYNSTLADAYVTVAKAETVSGKVTGYKGTENVTLDGTVYKIYNKSGSLPTNVAGETGEASFTTGDIGETFTLYLVNGYVGAAVQTSETATNYSLVIDRNGGTAGSTLNPLKVVVLGADGAKTVLTVSDKGATPALGDIVTYTGTADNAKINVEAAKSGATSNTTTTGYDKTAKTFNGTVTAANAVLFRCTDAAFGSIANTSTYKAYNIRDMKSFAVSSAAYTYVTNDDGMVVAVFIGSADTISGNTSAAVIGIVTASNGVVEFDDVEYNQYTVASNGTNYTVNIERDGSGDTLTKGNIVAFAPTADEKYEDNTGFVVLSGSGMDETAKTIDGTSYDVSTVYVKNYDEAEGLLTYYKNRGTAVDGVYPGANIVTKAVSKDVTIIYVDIDNDTAGDEIGVNAFDGMSGKQNAMILEDNDNVITHIIVETSGEGHIYQ